MLIERVFNRSDPKDRVIETNNASPKLASHAPKVRIIREKNRSVCDSVPVLKAVITTKVRIVASKAKSLIRRWWR